MLIQSRNSRIWVAMLVLASQVPASVRDALTERA